MASSSSPDAREAVPRSDLVAGQHSDSVAKQEQDGSDDDLYFPIFALLPGGYSKVLALLPDVTVEELKRLIFNEIGIPPAYVDLWHGNAYLYDDNATMEQLGVEAGTEILLALRMHQPPMPYGLSFRYMIVHEDHNMYVTTCAALPPNNRDQLAFLEEFKKIGGNKGHYKGGGKGSGKFKSNKDYDSPVDMQASLSFYPSY